VRGELHPNTATVFNNLGVTFGRLGDRREELKYEQRCLDIRREVLGQKHPHTAIALSNVGLALNALGESVKALDHMRESLGIRREVLGDRHPHTIQSWENVVELLLRQKKKMEALTLVESDLKKFPQNATLKRLKNEILGKHSAKTPRQPAPSAKKARPPKR
jgi:hypothetical protein